MGGALPAPVNRERNPLNPFSDDTEESKAKAAKINEDRVRFAYILPSRIFFEPPFVVFRFKAIGQHFVQVEKPPLIMATVCSLMSLQVSDKSITDGLCLSLAGVGCGGGLGKTFAYTL